MTTLNCAWRGRAPSQPSQSPLVIFSWPRKQHISCSASASTRWSCRSRTVLDNRLIGRLFRALNTTDSLPHAAAELTVTAWQVKNASQQFFTFYVMTLAGMEGTRALSQEPSAHVRRCTSVSTFVSANISSSRCDPRTAFRRGKIAVKKHAIVTGVRRDSGPWCG